jgi:hypothetical protein
MWILAEQEEHLWNELHLLNIGAFGKMVIKFWIIQNQEIFNHLINCKLVKED